MITIRKILLVFGTRPEAIKMSPLILEYKKYPEIFEIKVCVTGQHRGMLDQVLELFEIMPEYDLDIMKKGQDLYDITSRILLGMRAVLNECKPSLVLVHGDTSTSMAVALAAFYQQIPVGHVEAGLRTRNIYSPWPEEINRQLIGRIARYHFTPTEISRQNLLDEGVIDDNIFVTGNTVIDALFWGLNKIDNQPKLKTNILNDLTQAGLPIDVVKSWSPIHHKEIESRKMILITGHRRENFGEGFINICEAIRDLSLKFPDVDFVYPMHLNPNVREAINKIFGIVSDMEAITNPFKNIYFVEPLDYLPFIFLMNNSYFILTDSGGIQEEAPSLGKPVLVMRDTTERPEALSAGSVKLVGANKSNIINAASELILNSGKYIAMSNNNNPYGNGTACEKIVQCFLVSNIITR